MTKLKDDKKLVIKIADILREIEEENKGTSFINYAVGIVDYLEDNYHLIRR